MKRNMDENLRELERRATIGDESDVLAFLMAAERAGRSLADLDMRPSMQQKALDALSSLAEASGSEESIEAYLKALVLFGYPTGRGTALHGNDLTAAVAVALFVRGADPEAVYQVMSREDTFDGAIGPMLDELENECTAVARDLAAERRRARRRARRPPSLTAQRREALETEYQRIRDDNVAFWASTNTENESPWRRNGDAYRRQVWISDGMGWSDTVNIDVTFEAGTARIVSSTAVSQRTDEPIDSDNA